MKEQLQKWNVVWKGLIFAGISCLCLLWTQTVRAEGFNGVYQNENGIWTYYENGSENHDYTGLAQNENGWWYVKDGVVDFTYNGLVEYNGQNWCVFGGGVAFDYTNVGYVNDEWRYIAGGVWQNDYTGLAENEFGWWYVSDGIVDFTYAGYVPYNGSDWCVSGGTIDFSVINIVPWEGKWYKIVGGRWDKEFTGLAENDYGWWYLEKGLVKFDFTGLSANASGWWYVVGGGVAFDYTGTVASDNKLFRCVNGACEKGYTGLLEYKKEWIYVEDDVWNPTFTGITNNEAGEWYVHNGEVEFSYVGKVEYRGVTYNINAGSVISTGSYTGVTNLNGQKVYLSNGVHDTSYNGVAKDIKGLQWHVKDGYVDGSIGIDVSVYQGTIDWDAVKADGVQYAIIRVGYGNDDEDQDDRMAIRNMNECERVGMPYGVYLFSYAVSDEDARSETNHILRLLSGHNPQLEVYLDIEASEYYERYGIDIYSAEGGADIMRWLNIVMDGVSPFYKTGVYANYNYFRNVLDRDAIDEDKWLAYYGITYVPDGNWIMWQYSSDGSVAGINGRVDMNVRYQ